MSVHNKHISNALINESSPYLLQHAYNPVHWMPWNEKAWLKAKEEDKLVIVSIGYSACHWCHVMEHESFENQDVADLMSQHFVSIKVDREERPDIDHIYMDAVQLITGHGGWPLNAICLPDGKPVYAGTYFKREQWMYLLSFLEEEYRTKRSETLKRAEAITHDLKQLDIIPLAANEPFSPEVVNDIKEKMIRNWDFQYGGRRGAPKFPMPSSLLLMLDLFHINKDKKILVAITITLDSLIMGGIYDHVGGGFARYSVDEYWHIPHFEKMLYDNAQLLEVYARAFQLTRKDEYKAVVYRTFEFLQRDLRDTTGIYYSALDADSEGVEGKYYVWSIEELKSILADDYTLFTERFLISEDGNFEGENHLVRKALTGLGSEQERSWMNKLYAVRTKRIAPGLDDKSITSWNALLAKALSVCSSVFSDEEFLIEAKQINTFFKNNILQLDSILYRNYKNGKVSTPAFLEDYATLIASNIALYSATFNEEYLNVAKQLTDHCIQHFYNTQNGMFFFTSIDDEPLISRKTETADNVIPSSNAIMANALHYLGEVFDDNRYQRMALQMAQNMQKLTEEHPFFYSAWARLELSIIAGYTQVAVIGDKYAAIKKEFDQLALSHVLIMGAKLDSALPLLKDKFIFGETLIYVCKNKSCSLPVQTVKEAMRLINQ